MSSLLSVEGFIAVGEDLGGTLFTPPPAGAVDSKMLLKVVLELVEAAPVAPPPTSIARSLFLGCTAVIRGS